MRKSRVVPQHEIDSLEEARKELLKFSEDIGLNIIQVMRIHEITGVMWRIANTRFPVIED